MKDKLEGIKLRCMTPKQLCLDEGDEAYFKSYKDQISYYDGLIKSYKEYRRTVIRDLAEFVRVRMDKLEGIEEYKYPGSCIFCNNMLFVCDNEGKFHYAEISEDDVK